MSHTALIFGGAGRIGPAIVKKFQEGGFRVAVVTRSATDGIDNGQLNIKGDLSEVEQVPKIFERVKKEFGVPSVVIYNAYSNTNPASPSQFLSFAPGALEKDFAVNTISALAAAREAVAGFDTLPADTPKSFIYTGNALNEIVLPVPSLIGLGTGKAASAYWIQLAQIVLGEKGYKFYFADERKAGGAPVANELSGPAHAEFYFELAQGKEGVPPLATFVKGKGYVKFSRDA